MKEYGGYIEFETFHGKMLHDNAVALNCGRGALEYKTISTAFSLFLSPEPMQ